jgi:hypothetical protein
LDILIRDYGTGDCAAVIDLIRELQTHERALYDRMKPPSEMGPWYIEKLLEACAGHRGRLPSWPKRTAVSWATPVS